MNQTEELVKVEQISLSTTEAQTRAEIDIQINTAKAFPRNIMRAKDNAIAVVTMDIETAKICGYTLPRDNKAINGESVHLMKIIAQFWGNLRMEQKITDIDATHVTSQATVHDLETNIAIRAEVKRSIIGKKGRYTNDMITVTGQAGSSIALRNALKTIIPKPIVDAVYKAAQNKIVGDISDEAKLIAKRKQILDGFINTYGVSEADVLKVMNLKTINQIKAEEMVQLIGIAQAIKDGEVSVDETFYPEKQTNDKIKNAAPVNNPAPNNSPEKQSKLL